MTNLGVSSQNHNSLYLGRAMECELVKWLIWAQEWKKRETNTDSRIWLKSSLGLRVGFDSIVGSKSKNLSSHLWSINGMWLSKIGGSISKFMGIGINVGSVIGSKLGQDTGVNIDWKIRTESQS